MSVALPSKPRRTRLRALASTVATLGAVVLPLAATTPAHASTENVFVRYTQHDAFENLIYEVVFTGKVSSNGPTSYTLTGTLDAWCNDGPIFTEYAGVAYSPASASHTWKTYKCSDLAQEINVTGSRKAGEAIDIKVGGTSGTANTWNTTSNSTYNIGS